MKILQIMAGASEGGAEIFFIDALTALKRTGIEQYVITRSDNAGRLEKIDALDISCQKAPFHKLWRMPTNAVIRKAIKDFQPDIVQYWMGRAASFAQRGEHINVGWYSSYLSTKRFQKCDHHIGVTQDVTEHIIGQGITPGKASTLSIYTQEVKNITAVSRQSLDTPKDAPLLLSLARLHPVKGLDILLEALTEIPDAYLWIAGSGPLENELKKQSSALGLNNRVRFLGWREDKEALMAAADICVFPSRNDSFGAVMIEAWASGTPLIATKAPGPKAYIRDGEDGVLVEIDDIRGLANAIQNVMANPALCQKMVQNGRVRFEENFTHKAFAKNALEIYRKLLEPS